MEYIKDFFVGLLYVGIGIFLGVIVGMAVVQFIIWVTPEVFFGTVVFIALVLFICGVGSLIRQNKK